MQNLPKIVQARLQRPTTATAESHPDADLLTAFAERSLAGRERDQVLEHLARCGNCRDVVALALPAQVELPVPAVRGANWFRWPVLRWAAVTAGVVLMAWIGTVQYHRQRPKEFASSAYDAKQAITTPAQSPQASSQVVVPQAGMRKEALAAPRAQAALAEKKAAPPSGEVFQGRTYSAAAGGGASTGGAIGGPVNGLNVEPRPDLAFAPAPQSPPPAATAKQDAAPRSTRQTVEVSGASQMVEVQSEIVQVGTPTATQNQIHGEAVQNEPEEQAADRVGKAKPALAQASPAMGSAPLQGANSSLMKSLGTPRWTISSTGALQRSLDGGNTWLDVNVAVDNSAVDESVSANLMRRAEAKAETKAETKASAKSRAASYGAPPAVKSADAAPAASASTIFRALSVSSNAAEVWAGGSGGALYHTVDGGNRWSRVVPSAAGIVLAGDIISIQFSDPRSGSVTTSNAEVWTTVDDGQTWHRQQ
jgi:hypothetical protein